LQVLSPGITIRQSAESNPSDSSLKACFQKNLPDLATYMRFIGLIAMIGLVLMGIYLIVITGLLVSGSL